MPVTVRLGSPFRRHTNGVEAVSCSAANLPQLFQELESRFPGLTRNLCTEQGEPRPFLNVYVNDEDIRFLGGVNYAFAEGDEVLLIPSIAGGCEPRRTPSIAGGCEPRRTLSIAGGCEPRRTLSIAGGCEPRRKEPSHDHLRPLLLRRED